jgi:hypothetical protein
VLKPNRPLIKDSLPTRIPIDLKTSLVKHPSVVETDDDDDYFYDAPDHFTDSEFDDDDDDQAPEDDISQMLIKFHPLAVWNNSEDNKVDYVLPPNFGEFRGVSLCELLFISFSQLMAALIGLAFIARTSPVSTSTSDMSTRKHLAKERTQPHVPCRLTFQLPSTCHWTATL